MTRESLARSRYTFSAVRSGWRESWEQLSDFHRKQWLAGVELAPALAN